MIWLAVGCAALSVFPGVVCLVALAYQQGLLNGQKWTIDDFRAGRIK